VLLGVTHPDSRRAPTLRDACSIRKTDCVSEQIPFVDYLKLGDRPHLVANECTSCGARYFDRRNACASCFGTEFKPVDVATEGTLRAFTIVSLAAPGIPVPFVSAIVDCDGTSVRGNLTNVEPDPEHVKLGMKVRLTTVPIGTDSAGTEAVNFAFEPAA
jgi:uncharacterized OB-fold protein